METLNAIIGAVLGGIIGFIASWLTLKYNYKRLFAETVSSNRMEWINMFRDEFATIVGVICILKNCKPTSDDYFREILGAEQARARLLTRLNMHTDRQGNEYNKVFAERLKALVFCDVKQVSDDDIQKLTELAGKILEHEWQRVKNEAKGGQK